jgi:hypothetical protein
VISFASKIYWVDLPLLIVLISLVYSGTRHDRWPAILGEALRWGSRLLVFLAAIMVILFVVNSM